MNMIKLRNKYFSLLFNKRSFSVLIIALLLLISSFIVSLTIGDRYISIPKVLSVIFGEGEKIDELFIQAFRMPRIIIAIFAGISLAIAGAILQGLVRNPLASPDILGITGGAGAAVVLFFAIFSDNRTNQLTVSIKWLPLAAFIGAIISLVFVYALAYKDGELKPLRLVLVGVGFSALAQATTSFFMIIGPIFRATEANMWLTGSVYGANWEQVKIISVWTLVLIVLALSFIRQINTQQLGDEVSTSLGVQVEKNRLILLFISTALVAGAVAFAGAIAFVGLIAPHIARKIVGASYGVLIPLSGIIGAIMVLVADTIGRTVFSPIQIPAGVFTAVIGAPYFIYLLFKTGKR
ncbi:FecCD family ABC transporter permease [Gottfriedia acidiceleris]|uniref:Iron ABC transporter permease n=1 Tax=Gottfriedia acidiceleris TaxID=371036 RepID=A0ABY4JIN6_9BACI|nr:iron ABC transporter permease [Gottfriedia acidiceleris]UPM53696.1 iron ABC transporter permease [Gottfriedia acidiceleris]